MRLRLCLLAGVLAACAGRPEPEFSEPDWAALAAERLPQLATCQLPGVDETLLCGELEVWEDRAAARGRRIALNLVVVPARNPDPPPDPVFVFEGGPGGAVTRRAAGMVYAGPVRQRDIVLLDQRGTGGSNPLDCALGGGRTDLGELAQMFPPRRVESCAETLGRKANLHLYTSAHFTDDVEEVRRRLGYGRLNIRGGSYGTWAMMVFAQRYPDSTRSLFGIGTVSPLRSNLAERGVWSERTLAGITAACAAADPCATLARDLDVMTAELLESLKAAPRRVELADPNEDGKRLVLEVGRDWLAEKLRLILYYTFTSRALPWAVHRAHAAHDWEPLVQLAVLIQRMFQSSLSYGVLLTVQCSEHMGFDVDEALARGADTLFGNYRLEQQIQGCAHWPYQTMSSVEDSWQVHDVPVLFLSGALDPVTPPDYAEEAAHFFPNSRHVVLTEGQHGPFDLEGSWECVHQVWADFLERGSVEGLAVECTRSMRRGPMISDGESFARYLADELARY